MLKKQSLAKTLRHAEMFTVTCVPERHVSGTVRLYCLFVCVSECVCVCVCGFSEEILVSTVFSQDTKLVNDQKHLTL